jgi:hypothetical protein
MQPIKTSLFISLCILRDLPQQKIPRELSGGGDPAIFLCSHVPMNRFLDGMDQENSEKTRRKKWRKEKEEILFVFNYVHGGSQTHVFSCVLHRSGRHSGYCPRVTLPQENPLVWEPPLQHNMVKLMGYLKTLED